DGLGLLDLTIRPTTDVVGGGQTDAKLIESSCVEQLTLLCGKSVYRSGGSDLVDRGGLESARDVDAQLLRGAEGLVIGVAQADDLAVSAENLDVQAERLHFLHEHLEGLGNAGLRDVLALDDRLVHLDAAEDVVGLDREQLLQGVSGAVGLEGPHLHLTEALSTELRLTTERLLRDHRVGTRRTRVDLVVHEVVQLEDVHVADRDRVRVRLAGTTVDQVRLAVGAHDRLARRAGQRRTEQAADLVLFRTVEHRGGDGGAGGDLAVLLGDVDGPLGVALDLPALLGDPAEVDLEHLTEVHSTGDTHRVEEHVERRTVLEERHVLFGEDTGDDTLVAVAAGELVALGDLALLGDVDHDAAVDARAQLVVAVLCVELLDRDDGSLLTVGHLQRRVANLAALLVEDRAEQALLGRKLGLALRRDLADEDVAGADLGADADDAAL